MTRTRPLPRHRPGNRDRSFRTCLLAAILLLGIGGASTEARQTEPPEVPSLEDAIPAWLAVRDWLSSGEIPNAEGPASRLAVANLSAVGVLLRLDGRVVGRGFDPAGDDHAVRRAFGRAMVQAGGDRTIRDLPEPWRSNPGSRLCLELELAGPRRPLVGGTLAAAARRLRPGLDGVAVVRGEEVAMALPGRLLSTGTADGGAGVLIRLLDELGLPPQDLPDLRRLDSVRLERFETLRLGQSAPDELPSSRSRLGSPVARIEISADDLSALAASLANRIGRWQPPPDPSRPEAVRPWLGNFDPVSGSHQPLEAGWSDRLMALWALRRSGEASPPIPPPTEVPEEVITPLEIDLALLAAAADHEEAAGAWLVLAVTPSLDESDASNPSLLARRAAALGGLPVGLVPNDRFDAAYLDAWNACGSLPRILAAFDWLCLAESAWWHRHGEPGPRVESLRAVRDSLLARQIDDPKSDLDGSIPLRGVAEEVSDARCLRLLLGMAALRLVPDEDELGRARGDRGLSGLIRFLRQLQFTPEEAADLPHGRPAIGGVQAGPADPRQPLIATAVALIAVDLLREAVGSP